MSEFWENAFQEKKMMWGEDPVPLAIEAAERFKQQGLNNILIPGFGYGRNAKPFYDNGCEITGIEISGTAIQYAREFFDDTIQIFHGSVDDMPFDENTYDGIFCHALIHLLDSDQRKKFILDCYNQLRDGGMMFFTAITKDASTFGVGEQLGVDWYRTRHGVNLYFYDEESIKTEFAQLELIDIQKVDDERNKNPDSRFWKIVCKK